MTTPSFDDIFAVMSAASVGDLAARVTLSDDAQLDDTPTRFAIALNILLDDLALSAAEGRRELAERERLASRLQILAEAAREFSATTDQLDRLLDVVARRLGDLVGDLCTIRSISEDGAWLESTGAVYHRDPALLVATRAIMSSGRQRVGEGVSGRVAATGKTLFTPTIDTAAFAATSEPRYREFLERLGVTSAITLPLLCGGRVVGIANLMRSSPDRPYSEDDLRLVQSIADHAALAIGNARAYAAERAARAAAEQTAIALQRSEARLSRLREAGILGMIVTALDGRVVDVNDTLLQLLDYSRDEILSGRVAWTSLTPPEWSDVDARAVAQLKMSGLSSLREKEYIRNDGKRIPVLARSAMLDDGTGECISFVLDLSERKEAQAAIQQLHEARAADAKFRLLLEAAPDAMVIVGGDGLVSLVNGQVETLFGYDRAELIGQRIELLIPERFHEQQARHRIEYLRNPDKRLMGAAHELCGRRKDGSEFPVEISLSPLATDEGVLVSSAIRDITARKSAEHQRSQLAAIVEASDDAIIGKTLNGEVTSWNGGARRLFGYAADEMVGKSISLLIPPGREQEEAAILEALGRGETKRFETVRRRKDGRDIDVSVTSSPMTDGAGNVVGISKVARDISERKHAEQQRARLAAIVDSSDDAIIGLTVDNVITSWNRGADRLFGYTAEEVVGQSFSLLVLPGSDEVERATLESVTKGEVVHFDAVRRRKDGRNVDVSVVLSPVRDAEGRVVGLSRVTRDITDRKRAEDALARAKDAAEAATRELEAFSYSVAHDLRAPLRGMNGFAQVLLDTYKDRLDAEGQDWLQEILLNAKKMADLIDGLLSLARVTRSELKSERVDLSALVREAAGQLATSAPPRTVAVVIQDGLHANVDPRLARVVLANLLGNAWKFTCNVTAARIEFGEIESQDGLAFFIRDNGAGFEMAYASKLFAPFQRLHTVAEFPGTGIGLATVQRIVHRHGGRIWAEAAVNAGATFYFTFARGAAS